jgi:hypothetical protein
VFGAISHNGNLTDIKINSEEESPAFGATSHNGNPTDIKINSEAESPAFGLCCVTEA